MNIVFIGLTLTSSWGNGHATTYRALIRALTAAGHNVIFFEQDVPWYARNRDMPSCDFCSVHLYQNPQSLNLVAREALEKADAVILGSYTNDAPLIADWLFELNLSCPVLFYDIDTPVTLAKLAKGECEYLKADAIKCFDAYLSFSGGKALDVLASRYKSPHPEAFYCSADPEHYYFRNEPPRWALGYLGTFSEDRQPTVEKLLLEPARQMPDDCFVVAGAQYPPLAWPVNCEHIEHLPPHEHCAFYNQQCFTLNVTRADMKEYGWSPSVRLFEAAACGVPVISDWWEGLDELFVPGKEILIADSTSQVLSCLWEFTEFERRVIGQRARDRFLREHSPAHRVAQLEHLLSVLRGENAVPASSIC